jgi:RNA polymerase sigma-70 factor, ECF subfamily
LLSVSASTIRGVDPVLAPVAAGDSPLDPDSRAWVDELALPPGRRDEAVARLHAYLIRVARFEVNQRRAAFGGGSTGESGDIATQAADDALMAILRKLPSYRGDSRFTTWAAKFAILEASVKMRRRAWQNREVTLDPEAWQRFTGEGAPHAAVEHSQLLQAISDGVRIALSPHQREILIAVTLDDVPIDVLAERLQTTRGPIYKTLHVARRNLSAHLSQGETL